MQIIRGYVSSVIFRNKENLYTVFEVVQDAGAVTCTGTVPVISEGETVEVTGEMVLHPVYGEQLKVHSCSTVEPEGIQAVTRYLSSGAIRGIGGTLAARIVRQFGEDTMRILDEEPERLSEVRGISGRSARAIAAQLEEKRDVRKAMVFLQRYGLSGRRALRVWESYGDQMYEILRENPYRLADEIEGIGFSTADEIAAQAGLRPDSAYRVRSGILYILSQNLQEGSSYLPEEMLLGRCEELLKVPRERILSGLQNLAMERKVRILAPGNEPGGQARIYAAAAYRAEQDIAHRLLELETHPVALFDEEELQKRIYRAEADAGMELDELQRRAVLLSVTRGVLLISGGPGTGKTTTINTIVRIFRADVRSILLAAPTGRAARRMSETTGCEAVTIHRLLGYRMPDVRRGDLSDGTGEDGRYFDHNSGNPLDADAIIIDEMSMVDLYLFQALLRAVKPGTKLILVGDSNQLPSVGPGRIFGDLLESGRFCSIILQKIFRQARESDIVMNAHRILRGEEPVLDNRSGDFFFLERKDPQVIYKHIVLLLQDKLPGYVGTAREDIQVLTPMRKGPLGSLRLNQVLQSVLNPPAPGKSEITAHDVIFREGDKVMQTRNNYQMEWKIPGNAALPAGQGTGIFNGDFGVIVSIDRGAAEMTVRFDEGRTVIYPFTELEDLELSYAITVHKSQGSEYQAVILPLLSGPGTLLNRNLLYTAVTRARRCVVILGSRTTVLRMKDNVRQNERFTGLADRLREMGEGED